jgi:hypothetical protein
MLSAFIAAFLVFVGLARLIFLSKLIPVPAKLQQFSLPLKPAFDGGAEIHLIAARLSVLLTVCPAPTQHA